VVRTSSSMAWRALCVLIGMMVFAEAGFAQQVVTPDTVTFLGHVVQMAPLEASGSAGASHVQGTVVLSVEVGTDGNVISAKAVSGPAALVPAAVDCAKQWKFRPFEKDGKKVIADGRLSFVFGAASGGQAPASKEKPKIMVVPVKDVTPANSPEARVEAKFQPLMEKCSGAVLHHAPDEETVSDCKQAADVAATFPPNTRYLEKRSAFVYAATAFANAGDSRDGEVYAQKAVAVVKRDHGDTPGNGAVYSTLGHIEAMQGDFVDADQNMTAAEDYDRKSIAWAKKNKEAAWVHEYEGALQADLRFHSLILRDMKRKHEAKKKLEEAEQLNP